MNSIDENRTVWELTDRIGDTALVYADDSEIMQMDEDSIHSYRAFFDERIDEGWPCYFARKKYAFSFETKEVFQTD